jgi:hypothetical protein
LSLPPFVKSYTGKHLTQPASSAWKTATWPGIYADVDGLLDGYRRRFGRDRVAVLSYELLRDQPERDAVSLADSSARTFSRILAASTPKMN